MTISNYFFGSYKIILTGYAPLRFINLCNNHHIILWNVCPINNGYTFYMKQSDYDQIASFLEKTKTEAVISEKLGLPVFMSKYKKRTGFLFGAVFCIAFLCYIMQFIWSVELSGNFKLTDDLFQKFLMEEAIQYGTNKKEIDLEKLEKDLRNEFEFISWANAKINGIKLVVEIKENNLIENEQINMNGQYGNIHATVDGKITDIITRNGVPFVKKGDEVKKGDMLISGIIPINNDDGTNRSYQYTHADGDILIQYKIDYEKKLNYKYIQKEYDQEEYHTKCISLLHHEFEFFKHPKDLNSFEIVDEEISFSIFKKLSLPIQIRNRTYKKFHYEPLKYSKGEMKNKLKEDFTAFCQSLEEKGVQIIQKNVKINYNSDTVCLSGYLIVKDYATTFCSFDQNDIDALKNKQPITGE